MSFAFKAAEVARSTAQIPIPQNPLEQVVGQAEAVRIALLAAQQKRNLLLVGPAGTGKSMLAQALAYLLPKPRQEVSVRHNPENPERPIIEVRSAEDVAREKSAVAALNAKLLDASLVPAFVAEKLGFRCRHCGHLSPFSEHFCPSCGVDKSPRAPNPFGELLAPYFDDPAGASRVHTTRVNNGEEEVVVYERVGEKVRVLDQKMFEEIDAAQRRQPRKVLVPLERPTFVSATGASETELLGDVRHDPYGGHPQAGTQPYVRVVAGAIHEAHEGVLFIDEVSALSDLQRYLLTAMQERKSPIVGRNPQSSGAAVKVDGVPCDFVLVAASNNTDLDSILPPLRSRILGNGYEVVLDTVMPDTPANQAKLLQFIAQEIRKDGKIPHMTLDATERVMDEARRRAREIDGASGALTLRLRELSGLVRLAGDLARSEGADAIEEAHVEAALRDSRSAEEQLKARYGSMWKAHASENAQGQRKPSFKEYG